MAAPSFHPALVGQQLAASQEELVTTCRLPCRQHIQPQYSFRFDWHVGYTPESGMHVVGGDEITDVMLAVWLVLGVSYVAADPAARALIVGVPTRTLTYSWSLTLAANPANPAPVSDLRMSCWLHSAASPETARQKY